LAINDRNHAVSANDPPSPAGFEARVAASERGGQPQSSEPASAQQSRVEAEISPSGAQREVGQRALAVLPAVSPSNAQAAHPPRGLHPRLQGRRSGHMPG
jgi:hypothetical protein